MSIKVIRSNGSKGNTNATTEKANKVTTEKANKVTTEKANKVTTEKANTANIDRDIKTVSLSDIKSVILNSLNPISVSRNNTVTNGDTADTLLDMVIAGNISRNEYQERLAKLGKGTTRTGDFRGIVSLNGERVSSKGILSESLLKGGKNCAGNSPVSLAVYKDNAHYDNICKLQDVLTVLLNIGNDTDTKFTARDFEIALYKTVHVAQSKANNYGIYGGDTEKQFVDMIFFNKE